MKKLCISLVIMSLTALTAFADMQKSKLNNLPQGTFKKSRSGQIIQYDKNGKKVGVYKIPSQRYIKK